jgi:hypothetical protein
MPDVLDSGPDRELPANVIDVTEGAPLVAVVAAIKAGEMLKVGALEAEAAAQKAPARPLDCPHRPRRRADGRL